MARRLVAAIVAAIVATALAAGLAPGLAAQDIAQDTAPDSAQGTGRLVLTREELLAGGVTRPSDVLRLAIGWGAASVDQVTWAATADGLPATGFGGSAQPGWALLIDGQPVAVELLDARAIDLLPIVPGQLDSVVVLRAPALVPGGLAVRGALHFHTRRPPRGVSARTVWLMGNETGDPGPFRYTPLATPNVDRIAADNATQVAVAGATWEVAATATSLYGITSDTAVLPAVRGRAERQWGRVVGQRAHAIRAGAQALGGRHELLLGSSTLRGGLFVPTLADEVDVDARWRLAAGRGTVALGRRARLAYRLQHATTAFGDARAEARAGAPAPAGTLPDARGVAHRRRRLAGSVEIARAESRVGIGATTWHARDASGQRARHEVEVTPYAELVRAAGPLTLAGRAAVAVGGRRVAPKIAGTARWGSVPAWVTVTLARHLRGEDGSWIDGWALGRADAPGLRLLALDAATARALGRSLTLEVGARAGVARDVAVLVGEPVLLSPAGRSALQPPQVRPADGRLVGAHAALTLHPGTAWRGRVLWRYGAVADGDTLRRAAGAVAAHQVGGSLAWSARPTLLLGATASWRAGATWTALPDQRAPAARVGPASALDVSARQSAWGGRVVGTVLVRNALGQPERYHPSGADLARRWYAALEVGWP